MSDDERYDALAKELLLQRSILMMIVQMQAEFIANQTGQSAEELIHRSGKFSAAMLEVFLKGQPLTAEELERILNPSP